MKKENNIVILNGIKPGSQLTYKPRFAARVDRSYRIIRTALLVAFIIGILLIAFIAF